MPLAALTLALVLALDPAVRHERETGNPRVATAMQIATPEFRAAIRDAVDVVDPLGEHPWLARELWRICKRESRCGQYGSPGLHQMDGWTGERSYARAVERGRLDPETCPAHRLGVDGARAFATRGGWGVNAARNLRYAGHCAGPESLDEPRIAALVAARMLVHCERGARACTCAERTALWTGGGILAARPLWSWSDKSRASTVAVQCGASTARWYALGQVLTSPWRGIRRMLRAVGW